MARRQKEECTECGEEDFLKNGLCEDCAYEEDLKEKRKACKKRGYHNWEIIHVMGVLPHQELQLECSNCELEGWCSFESYD